MALAYLASCVPCLFGIVCREQSLCKTSPVASVRMCSSSAYRFFFLLVGVCVFCTRLLTTAVHHHYYCTITTTVCTLLRWNALQMCISQHTSMNWVEFDVVPSREEYFHLPHKSLVGLFKMCGVLVLSWSFFLSSVVSVLKYRFTVLIGGNYE